MPTNHSLNAPRQHKDKGRQTGTRGPNTDSRGHGRSLYVAASTTFLRRDECDRSDKHRPSGSDPRSGQGDGSPTVFSKEGDASPAAASVLLLLAQVLAATPVARISVCPAHPSTATLNVAVVVVVVEAGA